MYDSLIQYDSYDIHLYIERFMNTNDTPLRYEIFCTRYDMYSMILTTIGAISLGC